MMAIAGPLIGLIVGALIVAVICLSYMLSIRRDYEEECADLRRQLSALAPPDLTTNLSLPDMTERAKIRVEAEVRMVRECEGMIIRGVRQALQDGQDSLNLNLKRFPAKVVDSGLNILTKDGDYSVKLAGLAADQTYHISWR